MSGWVELPGVGPDAGSLLGYLCALGTLRAVTLARPEETFGLAWRLGVGWRPVWYCPRGYTEDDFCEVIARWLANVFTPAVQWLGQGGSTSDTPDIQNMFDRERIGRLFQQLGSASNQLGTAAAAEAWAQLAAWTTGERVDENDEDKVAVTPLSAFAGAGRQSFYLTLLELTRHISQSDPKAEVRRALFSRWRFDQSVPGGGSSALRWHPRDDLFHRVAYAGESRSAVGTLIRGSELAANVLASVALPLYPVALATAGVRVPGYRAGDNWGIGALVFPLWRRALDLDGVRTLLWQPSHAGGVAAAADVVQVLVARRQVVGKGYYYFASTEAAEFAP